MRSSVSPASRAAQAARRRKSSASAGRSRAARRARRVAMRSRMPTSVAFICADSLMEIARGRCQRSEQRAVIDEPLCDQMHDLAVALDAAVHTEEARAEELTALALYQVVPHHHVDVAAFIFQRDKYHAARGI